MERLLYVGRCDWLRVHLPRSIEKRDEVDE